MMDSCDLKFIIDVPFFFFPFFLNISFKSLRGGQGIVRLDLGDNSLIFFLFHLKIESGDLTFVVGHCLFKTSIGMASSWWYFNGCTSNFASYGSSRWQRNFLRSQSGKDSQ